MKGTLLILTSFAVGALAGYYHLLPEALDSADYTKYALWALLFSLGISIGADKSILTNLRNSRPSILLVPLGTILGTWLGAALVSPLFTKYSVFDIMAVGSGFGYYSLSSIFITEYKGAELGTIALAANIIREMSALILAPILVMRFGKLAPIAAGGATTLDTTLPIITKTSGAEFVFIAMLHGLILDISIPFFVSFFCKL